MAVFDLRSTMFQNPGGPPSVTQKKKEELAGQYLPFLILYTWHVLFKKVRFHFD